MTDLKLPPHSVEAEQAVIGGLMLDNAAWDKIADRVSEGDFYRHQHRLIFRAIASLANRGEPLDAVTVAESLGSDLAEVGGLGYLATLAKDTPSAANIRAYADIVRERSMKRQVITVCGELSGEAYGNADAAALVDRAQSLLSVLADSTNRSGLSRIAESLTAWLCDVDERMNTQGIRGLSTPWACLDRRLSGLMAGDLIIVAGRPSMGKSALAFQMASTAAMADKGVAVFSLEMSTGQVLDRMVAQVGRIDHGKLRDGTLDDLSSVSATVAKLNKSPLWVDETSGLTVNDIRARARKLHREHPLSLVVIDYLQLIAVPRGERHDLDIAEITKGLKGLAKDLRLPVVLLSQLSRKVEERGNKRPVMSDLRDSGAIEQDADVILFPYRPEVYDASPNLLGVAELITAKHRNGPTGTDLLTWIPRHQRFEEMDSASASAYQNRRVTPIRRGFGE